MENILESACYLAKIIDNSDSTEYISSYGNTSSAINSENSIANMAEHHSPYLLGDSGIFSPKSVDFSSFLEEFQTSDMVGNCNYNKQQTATEPNNTTVSSSDSVVFDISVNNTSLDSSNRSSLSSSALEKSDISINNSSSDCSSNLVTSPTDGKQHKRPDFSFVEMIAQCMLAAPKDKVALSEIYDYILKQYPYFEDAPPAWRISVRHHLSTCEGFEKVGRVPLSRGFWWAAHPACKEDFQKGIIERKLIRKRLGNIKPKKRVRKPVTKKVIESQSEASYDINTLPKQQFQQSINQSAVEQSPVNSSAYSRLHDLSGDGGKEKLSSTPVRRMSSNLYASYPCSSTPVSNAYGSTLDYTQQINGAAAYNSGSYSPIQQYSAGYYSPAYPEQYGMYNNYYYSDSNLINGYNSNYGTRFSDMYSGAYTDNTNFSLPYGQYTAPGKKVQSGSNNNMSRYTPY